MREAELSSGTGMVLAKLGCEVCATDLASNLPLLAHNFEHNGKPALTRLLRCSLHHPARVTGCH